MAMDDAWKGGADLVEDEDEKRLIFSVLDSFRGETEKRLTADGLRQYRRAAHFNITHVRRQGFYALPRAHQDYLRKPPFSLLDTLCKVDDAIDENADLADAIMTAGAASLGLDIAPDANPPWYGTATKHNIEKCRSTINQMFRDWSSEGDSERRACFEPLLQGLRDHLPISSGQDERLPQRILVPGAGLGRLVLELCRAGYHAEGNEVSYHQLFANSYMLNCTSRANEWSIYPFAMSFANHHKRSDQLRKVMVPDVHPGSAMPLAGVGAVGTMSMTTGDFCVLYRSKEYAAAFDGVTSVFFIDTAPNVIRYVETVRNCLRPGGVWINVGPLLWHSEGQNESHPSHEDTKELTGGDEAEDRGIGEPGSFELSGDEVVMLIEDLGFELIRYEADVISTGYMQNPHSMLLNIYRPVHWIAKRKDG